MKSSSMLLSLTVKRTPLTWNTSHPHVFKTGSFDPGSWNGLANLLQTVDERETNLSKPGPHVPDSVIGVKYQ